MKQFKLIISTPKGNALEKDVTMLSLRGAEGSLAIMANHIPFITTTKDGEVKIIDTDGNEILANASSGMLTVTKESTTLLCGTFDLK
ncbi:MAG: F0F1 ATP synthase subunit epsilon [Clostridia bacterium]|nr:F0F1 ATP synthase subunit epsilon [Clostridia bacterium]